MFLYLLGSALANHEKVALQSIMFYYSTVLIVRFMCWSVWALVSCQPQVTSPAATLWAGWHPIGCGVGWEWAAAWGGQGAPHHHTPGDWGITREPAWGPETATYPAMRTSAVDLLFLPLYIEMLDFLFYNCMLGGEGVILSMEFGQWWLVRGCCFP
jgi:hypothetical protein